MKTEKTLERIDRLATRLEKAVEADRPKILSKAKLADLHYLEFWNMGWSGASLHPVVPGIISEIERRYLDEA